MQSCPLCHHRSEQNKIKGPDQRTFFLCENCYLIFVHADFFPSHQNEKSRYQKHQNSIDDKAYVDFLNQAIHPALPLLSLSARGLDFGCGPVPVLSQLLAAANLKCDIYDPFFFPKLNETQLYDFIFATECFEHFFSPANELQRIIKLLASQGFLIIMTELWKDLEQFSKWSYARDITHVSYFHANTIKYIGAMHKLNLMHNDNKRVFIFRKQ